VTCVPSVRNRGELTTIQPDGATAKRRVLNL
jgi:hypothetical protein